MRCKVGDLVVVSGVHGKESPLNLGRFGEVTHTLPVVSGLGFSVRPQRKFWGRRYNESTDYVEEACNVIFDGNSLTPIRPDCLRDETTTTKELELLK